MIREIIIRRFKRFREERFSLDGHIVLAGPNNSGKTTVLQAIAAWNLALNRWKELHDFQRHGGAYPKAPIARQAFAAVPLRTFDLLWNDRSYRGHIEIELASSKGWRIAMKIEADSTEQVYVRPTESADPTTLRMAKLDAVFIPPMSGLSVEEPVYQKPKINQLLALQKPGEVLRNILVEAHGNDPAWAQLSASIKRLFDCELEPPNATGADIIAEYRNRNNIRLDIRSAGSGFQQVLMLMAFLHTRPGSVLLVDEPDAHLHVILQDAIYSELRSVAARTNSQLVVATHSEVIINAVDPAELYILFGGRPRRVSDAQERARLAEAIGLLTHTDMMLALDAPGVLYLEGYTDLNNLREWARILGHPAFDLLTKQLFWRETVWQPRRDAHGIRAQDHYDALKIVKANLPGLILLDSDNRQQAVTPITGQGLQRIAWQRYETESYLLHPNALARFIDQVTGTTNGPEAVRRFFSEKFGSELTEHYFANPFAPRDVVEEYLRSRKAREEIIPPILAAGGLIGGIPYTRYSEIAALMKPEEIHPEVKEKLDNIMRAFGL